MKYMCAYKTVERKGVEVTPSLLTLETASTGWQGGGGVGERRGEAGLLGSGAVGGEVTRARGVSGQKSGAQHCCPGPSRLLVSLCHTGRRRVVLVHILNTLQYIIAKEPHHV